MLPPAVERDRLIEILAQLGAAVEELLLAGLTTASDATRQTLAAAMQEAARFRLLRLGSTLRQVLEEIGRFTSRDEGFSRQRLLFFLNRAWLLSRGLKEALVKAHAGQFDRLNWSPPHQPLDLIEVICLGVVKRVVANAFVSFEFRLRAVTGAAAVPVNQKLTWSVVFPINPGAGVVPAECYLHLEQKQKFVPAIFLEKQTIVLTRLNIARDEAANSRLSLTEKSTVERGEPVSDWSPFLKWSPEAARERVRRHKPGPLDLDTELQEEVVLREYSIGAPIKGGQPGQTVFPIQSGNLEFAGIVGGEVEGVALRERLEELCKSQDRPPLYGLMHYERYRLQLQPLSVLRPEPDYLTISRDKINKATLLKTLRFT